MLQGISVDEIEKLAELGPPVFSRKEAARLLGLSVGRLRNMDAAGDGPPVRFRAGRTVFYPSKPLFAWLAQRAAADTAPKPGRSRG